MELTGAHRRKSSRRGADDMCVEVATSLSGLVGVRDGEGPVDPVFTFGPYAGRVFPAVLPR
ncbi:DUF397 domain-containing protein [Micromonospora echinospora]|uniref:DUF397 domain-containing protein n=1 Tax=Micromonospora echinospora TaxID=1877 RepID=UPI003788CDDF